MLKKRLFTRDTHITEKRFINFKLYAKYRDRRCYHICPIEGGHRSLGNIQASFCENYNFNQGSLKDTMSLTVKHFTDASLVLKESPVKRYQVTAAYLAMVDHAAKGKQFFS